MDKTIKEAKDSKKQLEHTIYNLIIHYDRKYNCTTEQIQLNHNNFEDFNGVEFRQLSDVNLIIRI